MQLHDEADLINYRNDALARFVSNQTYLENVALKPFHVSAIAAPPSFPEELDKPLADLKPDDVLLGSAKLMREKLELLEKEDDPADGVLSEQSRFQRDACVRLALLQAQCSGEESIKEMELVLEDIVKTHAEKFGQSYVLEHRPYTRRSIPIRELDPKAVVREAPALYNPRTPAFEQKFNGDLNMAFMPHSDEFLQMPQQSAQYYQKEVNMDELNQFLALGDTGEMDDLMNFDGDANFNDGFFGH